MTDKNEKPKDVVEGFDLPEGEATPPPPGTGPTASPQDFDLPEESVTPPPFVSAVGEPQGIEPHVKAEEARGKKPESVTGKLIALVAIPIIAIVAIFLVRQSGRQPWLEYQADCKKTAEAFLKGMSEGSDESVPAAYNLLHTNLRRSKDVETVEGDFTKVADELGAFASLGEPDWDSAPRGQAPQSFKATAHFAKGECPVWFEFARIASGGKTETRISDYKLGGK